MKFLLKREPYISKDEKEKGHHCLLLWCSDGWRYNIESYTRHRFSTENDVLYCEEEQFSKKVFSDVLYHEHIEIIPVSSSPKIWIEKGDNIEKFSEIPQSQQL
jgi:hypothetical protein